MGTMLKILSTALLALALTACSSSGPRSPTKAHPASIARPRTHATETLHTFKKVQLTDKFWAEGANFGDFNHDGKIDTVSAPFWYEGPDFKQAHEFWTATASF